MNIQAIPRDDKVVKAAFVPKLDAFVFADYPNIELKLLAYYLESIGHPSMADVFRAGGDLYVTTAAGIFGKPEADVTDAERQVGKKLNLSIVYGGGMPTLMEQLRITAPEALALLRSYHGTWPGIGWDSRRRKAAEGTLIHAIKGQIEKRTTPTEPGYITTLYGRHLHPRSMHSALNALCQGCAADLKKWAMVNIHVELRELDMTSHIVNEVHDEIMVDAVKHEVSFLVDRLPDWMTDDRIQSVVPIRPTCEVSWTTWAEKQAY